MKTRKVFIVKLPTGKINIIPIEEITDCQIIIPDEKLGIWIHEKTIHGGASDGIGDDHKVRNLNEEDIETIIKNDGICHVEVDCYNKLSMPSNILGYKKVVIHLTSLEN